MSKHAVDQESNCSNHLIPCRCKGFPHLPISLCEASSDHLLLSQCFCETDSSSCLHSLLCISLLLNVSIGYLLEFSRLPLLKIILPLLTIVSLDFSPSTTGGEKLCLIQGPGKGFSGLAMNLPFKCYPSIITTRNSET